MELFSEFAGGDTNTSTIKDVVPRSNKLNPNAPEFEPRGRLNPNANAFVPGSTQFYNNMGNTSHLPDVLLNAYAGDFVPKSRITTIGEEATSNAHGITPSVNKVALNPLAEEFYPRCQRNQNKDSSVIAERSWSTIVKKVCTKGMEFVPNIVSLFLVPVLADLLKSIR